MKPTVLTVLAPHHTIMASSSLFALAASLALLSLLTPSTCFNPKNINHNTPGDALGTSKDDTGKTVSFHVEEGSNNIYFAVDVKYDGGDVTAVSLQETNSPYPGVTGWEPLKKSWGTIWRLDPNHPTLPPFSIQITDSQGNKLVAKDVIPPNWKPNTVYTATVA